jgi:hypothetical protein
MGSAAIDRHQLLRRLSWIKGPLRGSNINGPLGIFLLRSFLYWQCCALLGLAVTFCVAEWDEPTGFEFFIRRERLANVVEARGVR